MTSPIINRGKTAEDLIRAHLEAEARKSKGSAGSGAGTGADAGSGAGTPPATPLLVSTAGDYLKLENIVCTDADGKVFESYSELYLAKDIIRNQQGGPVNFTPYHASVYYEQNGLFLPSFALTSNILAALFQKAVQKQSDGTYITLDAEVKKVLDQYKDHGSGYGYHAQNTIIDFGAENVIHYPSARDYSQAVAVNASQPRTALSFSKTALQDSLLEQALANPASVCYVTQLTGLRHPSILVEIGNYFGKPARLWFSWSGQKSTTDTSKRAAWLGCDNVDYFNLNSISILDDTDAARGVRRGAPAGRTP
ncbi:hypothetical protein HZC30_01765 [Candidatus Woesearchaeota archaeon]|nr:hypothetical protein [Candidatus Woesearchaeota archaeon]